MLVLSQQNDTRVGDPYRQEMDVILLLSQRSVYVAWYDDEEEQVTQYQRIFLEDVERLEIGAEPAVFKSRFVCMRLYYRHMAEEGFFHTFRIPSMRLFNNVMVAVKNQEEAKEALRAIAQAFVAAQKILSLDLPLTERPKLDSHHQPIIFLRRPAAATALNALSQLSTPKAFGLLKPANLRVNLSGLNPMRQFRRQQPAGGVKDNDHPEDTTVVFNLEGGRAGGQAGQAVAGEEGSGALGTADTGTEEHGKEVDCANKQESLGHDDFMEEEEGTRRSLDRSENSKERANSHRNVVVMVKKDFKEISLDSCGILAASPTHVFVSSLNLAGTDKQTLRHSLDLDHIPGDNAHTDLSPNTAQTPDSSGIVEPIHVHAIQENEDTDGDVFETKKVDGVVEDRKEHVGESLDSGNITIAASKNVPERRLGRLRKTSSAEDVSLSTSPGANKEASYCVLDEDKVQAILSKTDQLHHPHLKVSLSDNALTLQQHHLPSNAVHNNPAAAAATEDRVDSNPFSRLRSKMSTLAVPRSTAPRAQAPLPISKSHIRKSQRAMEVFERLVREKLQGRECESRIMFI
nr:hypothetical protein BaRGS_018465 [Batillaria attramentaria]